MKNLLLTS